MSKEPVANLNLDYIEQKILIYLSKMQSLVQQKQISEDTRVHSSTLKTKLTNIQKLGYIVITQKGRANLIIITDEGTSALENWQKTTAGEKIIAEIEKELEKTFKLQ